MLHVDLEKFWADDKIAHQDNCFCEKAPQVALHIRMSSECVFSELGEEGDFWGTIPRERSIELNRRYNDKAEKIVGMRLLNENIPMEDEIFPYVKRIGEVFEGTYTSGYKTGEWLHGNVSTEEELEKLLNRVDKLDLREFMLPTNWESEKKRIYEKYGKKTQLLRGIRGPVTLAMSIYGESNLIYLYYDAPELYERFSQTIGRVILEMSKIMDLEAGYEVGKAPAGFWFADDNCALLSPEMYEQFGYPILKQIFEYFSPGENDDRFQHSDSAMGHLLPILGKLNLTGCNFGPTVLVDENNICAS
jgi:uroporphyrinogen decarboxylase